MPNPRFTIEILVLICWLCLDISIQAQPKAAKAGTATISGRVTLNGEPVANVVVALQNLPGAPPSPGVRVRTDGAGQFRFTGVTAGRYVLGALAPGFVTPSDQPYGPQGRLITVSEGENMDGVSIELKRGAAIAGRVTDSQRRAIAEENVVLTKLDEQGKPQQFNSLMNSYLNITDDRGHYRLFGLPAGRYLVSVGNRPEELSSLGGRRIFYPKTFHPDVTEESKAEVIELSEGGEATGVDITVAESKRAYIVSGRIVDAETGQPIAMTDVGYVKLRADGRSGGSAPNASRSDANGGFQLSLPPGKYSLFGASSNFSSQVDASGQFVIEGLTAGEYELRLTYSQRNNPAETDPQLRQTFLQQLWQSKQTVSVGATGVTKVTFTFDLSRKEGQ